MRRLVVVVFGLALSCSLLQAQDALARARQMEESGDSAAALRVLREAAEASGAGLPVRLAYAEFLDRHNDPGARAAYRTVLQSNPDGERKVAVLRRLVILDLLAGDNDSAREHLEQYRAAGGQRLTGSIPTSIKDDAEGMPTVPIPGPLYSFARMAALSPDLKPQELLPALARNIVTNGYQASSSNEALDQTEYLKLVFRYLSQARELEKLAGASGVLRIEQCESQQTADLLKVLGYRMRGACGGDLVLETVNASRAFLTIDSGFPLAELELSLRTNRPFEHDFKPTLIPVLYGPDYWLSARDKSPGEFIDTFMSDPSLCRLYLGMAKLDQETAEELRKAVPASRLRAFAHVLDFFGGMFLIREGKVAVPGGERSAAAWTELVGAPPEKGAEFIDKLISKDDGWMASYFDALARIDGPVKDYLTEPERMKRFYMAIRGRVTSPGPARPVFRSNTDLMLLTTRLRMEPNGEPHVPGGVEIWKNLFIHHPHGKYDGKLTRLASTWKTSDDVLEALFALCRKAVENEPLKMFMALSDLNRHRRTPLEPATVDRLARAYRTYSAQYPIFAEAPSLSDKAILQFMDTAESISRIRNNMLRANAAGSFQALVGLWQICYRNRTMPEDQAEPVLNYITSRFASVKEDQDVFESSYESVKALLRATGTPPGVSVQDRMFDLLAGATEPADAVAHQEMIQEMIMLFEAQKLVSLRTIFDIAEHLDAVANGEKLNAALLNRLAARFSEMQLPRASLTGVEKNALSFGYWTERHLENQRKLNIRAMVERAGSDPERIRKIRGELAPILRDTLVGFNYLYYAPPAAQVLRTNPLFVRSHDFLGLQGANQTWRNTEVLGSGWPSSAGGRLVGSLAGLPYALAEAEQNFLVPTREQALIWGDLVPQMILSAKLPRWWNVSPRLMHWTGLHIRYGESILAEAMLNGETRESALQVLEKQAAPARAHNVIRYLKEGNLRAALENTTPAELFQLAAEHIKQQRGDDESILAREIRRMAAASPETVNYAAVSSAFGTPKPTLTNSYNRELLFLRTFPTLMGYSSRIMAESWESSILYYAALADELQLPPARLNVAVPEWTRQTVERIFATHLEDWPALLRSLRRVADDVRTQRRQEANGRTQASLD